MAGRLVLLATEKTPKVFFAANLMTDFANSVFQKDLYQTYKQWLTMFREHMEFAGKRVQFYQWANHGRRVNSSTTMIGFYSLITSHK